MQQLSKKEVKRKNIAKSVCELFTKNGFNDISVSKIATTAGIGKGTIYEYFTNKEDIVFELMSCLQADYDEKFQLNLKNSFSSYDRIITLFSIFIEDNESIKIQKEIYKQFLIVCLTNPSKQIISYNSKLRDKYISVINQIIINKTISTKIYDTIIGFFIASISLERYNLEATIKNFIKEELNNLKENK